MASCVTQEQHQAAFELNLKYKKIEDFNVAVDDSKELGEEHDPVGLDGDTSGLDDGVHLVTGHLLTIVGEDERGVGASEVTRHCSARSEDGEVGGQRRVRGRGLR